VGRATLPQGGKKSSHTPPSKKKKKKGDKRIVYKDRKGNDESPAIGGQLWWKMGKNGTPPISGASGRCSPRERTNGAKGKGGSKKP